MTSSWGLDEYSEPCVGTQRPLTERITSSVVTSHSPPPLARLGSTGRTNVAVRPRAATTVPSMAAPAPLRSRRWHRYSIDTTRRSPSSDRCRAMYAA